MSRTNEEWRGELVGVGDAILKGPVSVDGQTASAPLIHALTAHLCPSSARARMTPEGTNGSSRA
jgi:hypothetical protein